MLDIRPAIPLCVLGCCTAAWGLAELKNEDAAGPSIKWGNKLALKACFGENYTAAGNRISHCFHSRSTFSTCCMLDKTMRDENDKMNNPIGRASLQAYREIIGDLKAADSSTLLTPWCTATGAQSCSHFISSENNKLARVKFVLNPGYSSKSAGGGGMGYCLGSASPTEASGCEAVVRQKFDIPSHAMPGVSQPVASEEDTCKEAEDQAVNIGSCAMPAAPR